MGLIIIVINDDYDDNDDKRIMHRPAGPRSETTHIGIIGVLVLLPRTLGIKYNVFCVKSSTSRVLSSMVIFMTWQTHYWNPRSRSGGCQYVWYFRVLTTMVDYGCQSLGFLTYAQTLMHWRDGARGMYVHRKRICIVDVLTTPSTLT